MSTDSETHSSDDPTRRERERRADEGLSDAHAAIQETDESIQEAAEAAADEVQEEVEAIAEEAAEAIEEATEAAHEAVQDAAETAADATPGADPDADVDAIADRVWNRLEERITALTSGPVHDATDAAEAVEDAAAPVLETTGDVARDVTRPIQEHWYFRPRNFLRKR